MDDSQGDSEFAKFAELYSGHSAVDLIKAMARLRAEKDAAEDEAKGISREYKYITEVAIPEKFAEDGVSIMKVDGIGRCNLAADIYASVKAGQKEAAYQWLSDIGSGDLIQPAVPPSTLKAFLKGRIKSAEDIPEEFFNCTPYQVARITKA